MTAARSVGTAALAALLTAPLAIGREPLEAAPLPGVRLPVEELALPNGMRFLLVHRPQMSTVAAGWVAHVGSADERPGQSGLSHFIEHLLFKGTRTVSARRLDDELDLLADLDRVALEVDRLATRPAPKTVRKLEKARARMATIQGQARDAAFLGEFSLFYSQAGATGLNANTLEDLTMFYVTLPAEKLELWFWLESDRLLEPIFREFYKEKRVIAEERRLRVGSTPTGPLDAEFRRLFWGKRPYAWLPLGSQEDIDRTTRQDVRGFFERHFAASNLTAVLVGDFDRVRARLLAQSYFGRLPKREPPERESPLEVHEIDAPPLEARCDCPPQVQLRYPSVSFRHPDSYRLQVLAGVLNGRTGRLHRSLVLEQQLAFSASVLQHPLRRAGSFLFVGESRGATDPKSVEAAWHREVARLVEHGLEDGELLKVKNQITADSFRRLQDPESLLRQLLIYDGLGEWRHINDWPTRILQVTEDEVVAVAKHFIRDGKPARAYYYRRTADAR